MIQTPRPRAHGVRNDVYNFAVFSHFDVIMRCDLQKLCNFAADKQCIKQTKIMKKLSNLFLTLAMVIIAGMTTASCSSNDIPSGPQNSALAKALVGEWIDEYDYDGTNTVTITTLYHFYDDGSCWKELNLVGDNEVFDQIVSRYDTSESTYTVDASGRVVVTIKNAEKDADETEVLTFDGTRLSVTYVEKPIIMLRATDAQTQFYQTEADAWHGGNAGGTGGAEGHPLSESILGEIVGTDGLAYALGDRRSMPSGVRAAGMVAYKDGKNGLVIALEDENDSMNWFSAIGEKVPRLTPRPSTARRGDCPPRMSGSR